MFRREWYIPVHPYRHPRAAALNDEIGNDAMERQSVIKPLPGQIHKILHRDRRFFLIELRLHVAFFSRNNRVFHRKFNKLISSLPLAPSDSQLLRNIPVPEFPAHDTEGGTEVVHFQIIPLFTFSANAIGQMIVNKPRSLQVGIANRGSEKLESPLFHIPAHGIGLRRRSRNFAQRPERVGNRLTVMGVKTKCVKIEDSIKRVKPM